MQDQAADFKTLANSEELVAAAAELKPVLAGYADSHEANGRVSPEVIDMLNRARLLDIMKPAAFGGLALPPSVLIRTLIELGEACPSTAWCASVANINAWCASYWPLDVQRKIWAERPDALVAGAVTPTGKCEVAEDGYWISGRWPFASNCDNSDWVYLGAMVPNGETVQPGWFLIPRDNVTIDHDSWKVSGLQGTGSKTVFADKPFFVPKDACVFLMDVARGSAPGHSIPGNRGATYAFSTFGGACLAGPILGMARGALAAYVSAMRVKARTPMTGAPVPAAHNPVAQARVGAASAMIDGAIALLVGDLERAEQKIDGGEILTVAERVRLRRDAGFAARQSVAAINHLIEGAGGSSSDVKQPIQRFWRDASSGSRHVSLEAEAIFAMVGQSEFQLPVTGIH